MCELAGVFRNDQLPSPVIICRTPVEHKQTLVKAGEPFDAAFAVKSGGFKTVLEASGPGGERVVDIHLPGEAFGFEGLCSGFYPFSVVATAASEVCTIRYDRIGGLGERADCFRAEMQAVMSERLVDNLEASLLIGTQNGEQRLAAFLLNLSRRLRRRALPDREFRLPIPRRDIANYLGLAVETVSRLFGRFGEEGLLASRGRQIRLLDLAGLERLAHPARHGSAA